MSDTELSNVPDGPRRRVRRRKRQSCCWQTTKFILFLFTVPILRRCYLVIEQEITDLVQPHSGLFVNVSSTLGPDADADGVEVVRPLIDHEQTFDIAATVWLRVEESEGRGENQDDGLVWEEPLFFDTVFRGLKLTDKGVLSSINFQLPKSKLKTNLTSLDLRGSFVLIPSSPSPLDFLLDYTNYLDLPEDFIPTSASDQVSLKAWPFPYGSKEGSKTSTLQDQAVEKMNIHIPLLIFHDFKQPYLNSSLESSSIPKDTRRGTKKQARTRVQRDPVSNSTNPDLPETKIKSNTNPKAAGASSSSNPDYNADSIHLNPSHNRRTCINHPYIITRTHLRLIDEIRPIKEDTYRQKQKELKDLNSRCRRLLDSSSSASPSTGSDSLSPVKDRHSDSTPPYTSESRQNQTDKDPGSSHIPLNLKAEAIPSLPASQYSDPESLLPTSYAASHPHSQLTHENCTRTYNHHGHWETSFEVMRTEDGEKEIRYGPYFDWLQGGFGPKDLVPIPWEWRCREAGNDTSTNGDSVIDKSEEYISITWKLSFTGRTPFKAFLGNHYFSNETRWRLVRPNDTETDKEVRQDVLEVFQGLLGYRSSEDSHPRRRAVVLLLSPTLRVIYEFLAIRYWYTLPTTAGTVGLTIFPTLLLSLVTLSWTLLNPASLRSYLSVDTFTIALVLCRALKPFFRLRSVMRWEFGWRGVKRWPANRAERVSERADGRIASDTKLCAFSLITLCLHFGKLHERYLISGYVVPDPFQGKPITKKLVSVASALIESAHITNAYYQQHLNRQLRTFSGASRLMALVNFSYHLTNILQGSKYFVGDYPTRPAIGLVQFVVMLFASNQLMQAIMFRTPRMEEDLHFE